MIRASVLLPFLIFLAGFQWPSPPAAVGTVFLQRTDAGFSPSLVYRSTSSEVASVEAGVVLFISEQENNMRRTLPGDLGDFVALAHEGGVRSVTAGFEPDRELRLEVRLNQGDRLGETLRPGAALKLLFQTADGNFANPMTYLPPFPDTRAPEIRDVEAVGEGGETLSFLRQSSVPPGFYTVSLVVVDIWTLPEGPNAIRGISSWGMVIDFREERKWSLDRARWGNGGPLATKKTPVGEWVLQRNRYALGRVFVNVGLNTFSFSATDASGVVAERTLRVYGQRP